MPMTVHQSRIMRRDLDFEYPHVRVLQNQVMMGLGGNVDFTWSRSLGKPKSSGNGQNNRQKEAGFHMGRF